MAVTSGAHGAIEEHLKTAIETANTAGLADLYRADSRLEAAIAGRTFAAVGADEIVAGLASWHRSQGVTQETGARDWDRTRSACLGYPERPGGGDNPERGNPGRIRWLIGG